MNHLSLKDLWPLDVYEGVRDQFRKEVIAAKAVRRVQVGPFMTFIFENRLTVKFQVQEILRVERISDPALAQEEVEGFNSMLPDSGQLSATLMIELLGGDAEVKAQLERNELQAALESIWSLVTRANQYVEQTAPFKLAKDPAQASRLDRNRASRK